MINRQVGAAHWRRTQYGPNVASLTLNTTLGKITIVNVYNLRDTGPRVREWRHAQETLQQATGEVILLDDFNIHHPRWGDVGVTHEQAGEDLHNKTSELGLKLTTPAGETTWRHSRQAIVINLTFIIDTL
jgi:Endonuclease-reverse transcriptase